MATIFKLKDVYVETVGLVRDGANRESFFLLKSSEEEDINMPNEVQETVEVTETEPVVEELKAEDISLVKKLLQKFQSAPEVEQEEVVEEELEKTDEDAEDDDTGNVEELLKAQEEIRKELEVTRKELKAERDVREQAEYLEKAQSYKALPVDAAELAKNLRVIANTPAIEYFETLLKAVDEQLQQTDTFVESGHSEIPQQPDTVLEKALEMVKDEKASDLKEALLSISVDEANAHIQKRRQELQGK